MNETPFFGRSFEETEIGRTWQGSGRTVTETDITFFAMLSGDWYPLHVNREYAAQSWAGERIAHGMLTLSMITGMLPMAPGDLEAFLGIDRCRFRGPVRIGDTISPCFEIVGHTHRDGASSGRLEVAVTVRNQHGEVILEATLLVAQKVAV